jgi:hypothetical protein
VLAVACGPGSIVRKNAVDTAVLASVERTVERVRGLRFTAPVPGQVLDEAEVAALLDGELAREFPPGELERLQAVYTRLGFLAPGTQLKAALQELYADQIAALYNPRTKTLSLTTNGLRQQTFMLKMLAFFTGRDLLGEVLVAHELTHALQDQHYGLPTTTPPITAAHGDRSIARRALVEGDASLVSVAYLLPAPLDPGTVQRFTEQVAVIPEELQARHPNVPEIIRAALAFQYNTGSVFASAAYLRGGWPAVDAAHRDPPTSSEQVLHPEKYFETRDRPVTVTLGGTEALERQGFTLALEDTLGELDVRVLVGRGGDAVRAADAAAGRGGDRLRAFVRGDEVAFVWLTTWDTTGDARQFADAVGDLGLDVVVQMRDARVLVVGAPDASTLATRVWARSTFSPEA